MHTFILTHYIYTQYFCGQYTYTCLTVLRHPSLCVSENPNTHSISVGLDTQSWRQNQCHHHLNRPHLASLCVGPVHWCVSVSPMRLPVVYNPILKSRVGNFLGKAAALRINLNLDGSPIASKSHTHPSHSQTCRILISSLSLGVPVPRPTQCLWVV